MLKTSAEALPDSVPLPEPDNDEELLLDAPETAPSEPSAFEPASSEQDDTEMVVDEEGRPKFAPGKDVVRLTSPTLPALNDYV